MSSVIARIVNNINQILERDRIKQVWLAEKLGKKQPQISRYLLGKELLPMELAEAIAPLIGTTIDDLIKPPAGTGSEEELRLACISAILRADRGDLKLLQDAFPHLFQPALNQQKGRSSV